MKKENLAALLLTLSALCYGLYPSFAKLTYLSGGTVSTLIVVSIFCRSLILLGSLKFFHKEIEKKLYQLDVPTFIAALMQALTMGSIFLALKFVSPGVMITIVFTHTTLILFYKVFKKHMSLSYVTIALTLSALFGVGLIVNVFNSFEDVSLIGIALSFAASLFTATRFIIFEDLAKKSSSLEVGFKVMAIATIISLLAFIFEPFSLNGITYVLLSGVTLGIGTFFTFYALSLVNVFKISLLLKLEPAFTILYAYLILNDKLLDVQYAGIAIVLLSLLLNEVYDRRNAKN